MKIHPACDGELRLGHIFESAQLDVSEIAVIRHTFGSGGLESPADVKEPRLLQYTREQGITNKLGPNPPRLWFNFVTDGGLRSRFVATYENLGEVAGERTAEHRYFDLRPSSLLSQLSNRLVIEWSKDPVNWAKSGRAASDFRVIEIADRQAVPFPGFDRVVISWRQLQDVVADPRYSAWRTALSTVKGIYAIVDATNGKLYIGKADGQERILQRWSAYAKDGHGGNVALKKLLDSDPDHRQNFRYSILRVFGPNVPTAEVNEAESHFKNAFLTRTWVYNLG